MGCLLCGWVLALAPEVQAQVNERHIVVFLVGAPDQVAPVQQSVRAVLGGQDVALSFWRRPRVERERVLRSSLDERDAHEVHVWIDVREAQQRKCDCVVLYLSHRGRVLVRRAYDAREHQEAAREQIVQIIGASVELLRQGTVIGVTTEQARKELGWEKTAEGTAGKEDASKGDTSKNDTSENASGEGSSEQAHARDEPSALNWSASLGWALQSYGQPVFGGGAPLRHGPYGAASVAWRIGRLELGPEIGLTYYTPQSVDDGQIGVHLQAAVVSLAFRAGARFGSRWWVGGKAGAAAELTRVRPRAQGDATGLRTSRVEGAGAMIFAAEARVRIARWFTLVFGLGAQASRGVRYIWRDQGIDQSVFEPARFRPRAYLGLGFP